MTLAQFVGKRLRQAREEKGLSQQEVADALGVTQGMVGHLERGVTLMTLEHLLKLPGITDKPVTWFLPGEYIGTTQGCDPLLRQVMTAWPILSDEARQAIRHLTVTFVGLEEKRKP